MPGWSPNHEQQWPSLSGPNIKNRVALTLRIEYKASMAALSVFLSPFTISLGLIHLVYIYGKSLYIAYPPKSMIPSI